MYIIGDSSVHSRPKHYPNVTTDSCGRETHPLFSDNKCFKYHNKLDSKVNNIPYGQALYHGHFSWNALILVEHQGNTCGLVCRVTNVTLYLGKLNVTNETMTSQHMVDYYLHPDYNHNETVLSDTDLALIKMDHGVVLDHSTDFSQLNSICLPVKDSVNDDNEYAILNVYEHNQNDPNANPDDPDFKLKTGLVKIYKIGNDVAEDQGGLLIIGQQLRGSVCDGVHFGGPLYQSVNGVAVLIGIAIGGTNNGTYKID
ncbi:unnamed protein product, partial [Medioppia subpectinata]